MEKVSVITDHYLCKVTLQPIMSLFKTSAGAEKYPKYNRLNELILVLTDQLREANLDCSRRDSLCLLHKSKASLLKEFDEYLNYTGNRRDVLADVLMALHTFEGIEKRISWCK